MDTYIEGEGGYFRKCYFILPKTEKVQELFFNVAHELSHYWWSKANQQKRLAQRKLCGVQRHAGHEALSRDGGLTRVVT